jgi:hypothetical protein
VLDVVELLLVEVVLLELVEVELVELLEVELVEVDEVEVVLVDVVVVEEELVLLDVLVVVDVVVVGGPMLQSVSDEPREFLAMNLSASSFLMVAASKSVQFRSEPVVMRITTAPWDPASARPVSLATILSTLPSLRVITLTGVGPAGASLLTYLKRSTFASLTFHPGGRDSPAGTTKEASASSRDRISMSAPPGLPFAGSSGPPIVAKRNEGSLETKTNFSLPDPDRLMTSLVPSIG